MAINSCLTLIEHEEQDRTRRQQGVMNLIKSYIANRIILFRFILHLKVKVILMTAMVSKEELKIVLSKLEDVQIELMRLRAMLLPEVESTEEEKKEIEASTQEFKIGRKVKLEDLAKELNYKR